MHIVIVSATKMEVKPSAKFLKGKNIQTLITGVGMPAAMYAITKAVGSKKPDLIIQAGIGGAVDKSIRLTEVLTISQDGFGDMGVWERRNWNSVFDLGLLKLNTSPFKNGILKNPHKELLRKTNLKQATAITVNEITTDEQRISIYKSQEVVVESMEGAALHYVALMEKIPFLQIRSISNYVGERNKDKWELTAAINALNDSLVKVLSNLI